MKLKEKKNTVRVLAELNDDVTCTRAHTRTFKMPHIQTGFLP